MAQPHTKDVAFIYGKLNGVDGAEVTVCAGGAAHIRFVSGGVELDTSEFHGQSQLVGFAAIKSLRVECVPCGGGATTMVSSTLHAAGREGFGLSVFSALPLEGPVAQAVVHVESEVQHSCATEHVKDRVILALRAYAGTATLIPAFQITQVVCPQEGTGPTRVLISHVRTCTMEFLAHLVSTPSFGVTRAIFRSTEKQLELWFTGGEHTQRDSGGVIERPRKRQKQGFNIKWPFS